MRLRGEVGGGKRKRSLILIDYVIILISSGEYCASKFSYNAIVFIPFPHSQFIMVIDDAFRDVVFCLNPDMWQLLFACQRS